MVQQFHKLYVALGVDIPINIFTQFYDSICEPCGRLYIEFIRMNCDVDLAQTFMNYTVQEMQVTCGVKLSSSKHFH